MKTEGGRCIFINEHLFPPFSNTPFKLLKLYEEIIFLVYFANQKKDCQDLFEPAILRNSVLEFLNNPWGLGSRNRVEIGLSYRPARPHRLAESIPWN
jgi:hypothetical protein